MTFQVTTLLSHCIIDGNPSDTLVIFAHGAGANMSHEFMTEMAQSIAKAKFRVVRFNFPYMQANLADGKRRPPDRAPKLIAHFEAQYHSIVAELQPKQVVLVGKSMGGRMAAILAATVPVAGVVCLGYPFAPKLESEPRLAPLENAKAPVLIVQGERDSFGGAERVANWPIPEHVAIHWLKDGDHSFKPRKSSGVTLADNMTLAVKHCIEFIGEIDA